MLVGEIKSQIQSIWDDFWAGGLANPLAVMEQITYLLFIKRLDELQTLEENKSTTLNIPLERRIFPEGCDGRRTKKPGEAGYEEDRGRPYDDQSYKRELRRTTVEDEGNTVELAHEVRMQ